MKIKNLHVCLKASSKMLKRVNLNDIWVINNNGYENYQKIIWKQEKIIIIIISKKNWDKFVK